MQPVAAEQQHVVGAERPLGEVDLQVFPGAEYVGEHVPHRMVRDLLGTHVRIAGEDARGPRIVFGQLLQRTVGEQVETAVADMADRDLRLVDEQADDGGAHAGIVVLLLRRRTIRRFARWMAVRRRLPSKDSPASMPKGQVKSMSPPNGG